MRLPIRWRLTLAATFALVVVFGGVAAVLYLGLSTALDEVTEATLRDRAAEITTGGPDRLAEGGPTAGRLSFAQVLETDGTVRDATPGLGERVRLPAGTLAPAADRAVVFPRVRVAGDDEPMMVRATPATIGGARRIVVVGASLAPRDAALAAQRRLLAVTLPVALLLAVLTGHLTLAAVLRRVEAVRARAAALPGPDPGHRLPLPPAHDELHRLAATCNTLLDRVESAMVRQRRFVADAAHEMRTPLSLMRTELGLALSRPRPPAELTAALLLAGEEAELLARLTEDLLVLAQADDADLPLERTEVSTVDVLRTVARGFAGRAQATGRPVVVDRTDEPVVHADRGRLEQALTNLVDNAYRHGSGLVQVSARAAKGRVELHVQDGGPGLPPDVAEHAFAPFSRAERSRASRLGGAGLGLAIVAVIARAHGGNAHAGTTNGCTDLWLDLPTG